MVGKHTAMDMDRRAKKMRHQVRLTNQEVVGDRNRFKTETPKSNIELFKNRVLAKTDYLTETISFGQNMLFWPNIYNFC